MGSNCARDSSVAQDQTKTPHFPFYDMKLTVEGNYPVLDYISQLTLYPGMVMWPWVAVTSVTAKPEF